MVSPMSRPTTLGELRESGWESVPVKGEMRRNAVEAIRRGDPLFPGVLGYDETVLPQLENALLGGSLNLDEVSEVRQLIDLDPAVFEHPSRAALLTGRYQQRFGFEFNAGGAARADLEGRGLDGAERTIMIRT